VNGETLAEEVRRLLPGKANEALRADVRSLVQRGEAIDPQALMARYGFKRIWKLAALNGLALRYPPKGVQS
jgi:hypothetical protein